jgi:hypothetical protein
MGKEKKRLTFEVVVRRLTSLVSFAAKLKQLLEKFF